MIDTSTVLRPAVPSNASSMSNSYAAQMVGGDLSYIDYYSLSRQDINSSGCEKGTYIFSYMIHLALQISVCCCSGCEKCIDIFFPCIVILVVQFYAKYM